MPLTSQFSVLIALSVALGGCAKPASKPAPPVRAALSPAQQASVLAVISAAIGEAPHEPLQVVPKEGVRWRDISRAVRTAGKQPDVSCAVVHAQVGDDQARFRLRTVEGWPVVLQVQRVAGGIEAKAVVGPYPGSGSAGLQARSRALEQAVQAAIVAWSAKPAVGAPPPLLIEQTGMATMERAGTTLKHLGPETATPSR